MVWNRLQPQLTMKGSLVFKMRRYQRWRLIRTYKGNQGEPHKLYSSDAHVLLILQETTKNQGLVEVHVPHEGGRNLVENDTDVAAWREAHDTVSVSQRHVGEFLAILLVLQH